MVLALHKRNRGEVAGNVTSQSQCVASGDLQRQTHVCEVMCFPNTIRFKGVNSYILSYIDVQNVY